MAGDPAAKGNKVVLQNSIYWHPHYHPTANWSPGMPENQAATVPLNKFSAMKNLA